MPFVKLDCAILTSSLWQDVDASRVFITALLMAYPRELKAPTRTLRPDSTEFDDFTLQPGWYGFVPASGPGIVRQACVDSAPGWAALQRLSAPDPHSRSREYEGRRLVRVDGGYIALNYDRYREHDYSAAARMRDYRGRKQPVTEAEPNVTANAAVTHRNVTSRRRNVTQAEGEVEVEVEVETATTTPLPPKRVLPFTDPAFAAAWSDWETHRSQIRHAIKPSTRSAQLQRCQKEGAAKSIAVIRRSIENGWVGLFWDHDAAGMPGPASTIPATSKGLLI